MLTTIVAAAAVVVLIVLVAVIFMIVCVCLRSHKRKKVPLKVGNFGCVEDSMTEANKESETQFTNSVHKAASVNNKQLMSVSSIPVLDGIYSNPDEVENVATTLVCLRKHEKKGKDEASNIQCEENSAYQEVEHGNRVDHIQCVENSAYLEIKHEREFQCRENCAYQDCHTNIEVDNIQSSISYYEECM